VVVLGEHHLRRILREYVGYNADGPHLSLEGDTPMRRDVEPPSMGRVVAIPRLGGLHHRYRRIAA
jgi:putative transposase